MTFDVRTERDRDISVRTLRALLDIYEHTDSAPNEQNGLLRAMEIIKTHLERIEQSRKVKP